CNKFVEQQQQSRRRVDRHRRRDIAERDPLEQDLHVRERVDRDPGAPDLSLRARVVRVVADLRRQVEGDGEAVLAAGEQVAEPRVRLFRRGEAGVLADRPGPPAVHVAVRPARERRHARRLELARRVVGSVDPPDFDSGAVLAPVGGGHESRLLRVLVRVRLFAGLRERAGWSTREIEAARVADVWPSLGLGMEPHGLLYAVNHEYVPRDHELADGDEVALIPPVSGGAFVLSAEPLSLERAVDEVRSDDAGAIATFIGTARNRTRGRTVLHLDYEAYEGMAERVMAELAETLRERHEVTAIAIHHRVGRVPIGEASVVVAVSAPHRAAALAACREAIHTLKETVPLWKKEVYEGGEEWVGKGS